MARPSYRTCTEPSPRCPVQATTYGYYPHFAGNTVLLVVFALCTLGQLFLGIKARLRAFTFAVGIGCVGEAIGYGGRLMMNKNPWNGNAFKIQIVCLVLAPSFLAAGIYLTLQHLINYFGPQFSRLKPHLYTRIFISCDFGSILLQACGGGIAAAEKPDLVNIGNNIIVAGISFQVATMAICGLLAAEFAFKTWKHRRSGAAVTAEEQPLAGKTGFKYYLICSAIAFVAIFIRCIYRIPEMVGGWGNPLMRNEKEFLVLDGAMIAIACVCLTIAHPGIFFPQIGSKNRARMEREKDESPQLSS